MIFYTELAFKKDLFGVSNVKKNTIIVITIVAMLMALSACESKDTANNPNSDSAKSTGSSSNVSIDNATIATVDGNKIRKDRFDAYMKFKNISASNENNVAQSLDSYLEREALAAAIAKTDSLDPVMVETELNEFRKQMLISRYFDQYLSESVTANGIRNYYASNAEQFESKQVHVAHILFRVDSNAGEEARQAILTNAHEAHSKLKTGEEFAAVVTAYSQDKLSAKKGGDLGWIKEGAVAPEFSKQAFALSAGDISDPFITPFGFHIIKVLDAAQVVKKPLEAVEGDIRYQLRNEAKKAEAKRLLSSVTVEKK